MVRLSYQCKPEQRLMLLTLAGSLSRDFITNMLIELISELSESLADSMKQPDLLWYCWVVFQSWSNWRVMLVLYRQSSNLPDFTQGPFLFGHIFHKYVFGYVVFVCVCVCGGGQDFVGLSYHVLYCTTLSTQSEN